MSECNFNLILELVSPAISKQDTNYRDSIPAKVRLAITLRFLATGDSYKSLMYLFKVSSSSISLIIPEVCKALTEVLQDYIKIPKTEEEWKATVRDFYTKWNFPHCLGAMDGKHVVLQCPAKSGSQFYNYKSTFSIVLFAIVDANYCFQYAHVGCQGRISDGGVFRNTPFYTKMVQNQLSFPEPAQLHGREVPSPYVLVADDAFPLTVNIMKPYPGLLGPSPQRIFNYRLSRARRVVENTFGLLASVFRMFRKPLLLNLKNAELVIVASLYLHNYLRKSATSRIIHAPPGTLDLEDTENGMIIPGSWRKTTYGDTGMANLLQIPRRPPNDAKLVREEFMQYFMSEEGRVEWQESYQ